MRIVQAAVASTLIASFGASADTIVQEGGLSGSAGPPTEHLIELDRFDTLDGTRQLNFVLLEFTTALFAESVTTGAGGFVDASAELWADYFHLDGPLIAETDTSISVTVDNFEPPVATLYLDIDEVAVEYVSPRDLAPWIGTGTIVLSATAQLTVLESPPDVIEWFAGGEVTYRVTYDFDPVVPCPADLDGSGSVDSADLTILLSAWKTAAGDITGDGTTDAEDLTALLAAWGAC